MLCDDEYAPITSEIGFLECTLEEAASRFQHWRASISKKRAGSVFTERHVEGPLRKALQALLPLTMPLPRRFLFAPTASSWVGYFDNSGRGADVTTTISVLTQEIGCRGVRIVAVPDTIEATGPEEQGRYGARIFDLFGPEGDELGYVRSVAVVNDGGKWVFDQNGSQLLFEDSSWYQRPRIPDRFSFDELSDLAAGLGIAAFDEGFYLPGKEHAILLELKGSKPWGMKVLGLTRTRAGSKG